MRYTFTSDDEKPVHLSTEDEAEALLEVFMFNVTITRTIRAMQANLAARVATQELMLWQDGKVILRGSAQTDSTFEFAQAIKRGSLWAPELEISVEVET